MGNGVKLIELRRYKGVNIVSKVDVIKYSTKQDDLYLRVATGHFATSNCHSNYYIDVVAQKARLPEAKAVAKKLSSYYYVDTPVDTVLCLDGTEVIGTCLANFLAKPDYMNLNANKTICIVTPETTHGSQLLFRDNIAPMITGKNVIILAVSVASGKTVEAALDAITYYGGNAVGICSIFSTAKECRGLPVHSIFDPNDLENYQCYPAHECPMCKAGMKLDALVNSHGFSQI